MISVSVPQSISRTFEHHRKSLSIWIATTSVSLRDRYHGNGLHGTTSGSSLVNFDPSNVPAADKRSYSQVTAYPCDLNFRLMIVEILSQYVSGNLTK